MYEKIKVTDENLEAIRIDRSTKFGDGFITRSFFRSSALHKYFLYREREGVLGTIFSTAQYLTRVHCIFDLNAKL
jgi:hypothetical protein